MRTTLSVPDQLMQEALKASGAKTYTTAVVMGLQSLVHHQRIAQLRDKRGKLDIQIDFQKSRKKR